MPRIRGLPASQWRLTVRYAPAAVLIAGSLLLSSSPVASQVASGVAPSQEKTRRLAPDEISEETLASMFFLQVAAFSADLHGGAYQLLLEELGIPPGGEGDRALAEAARSAVKVIDWPEWPEGSLGAPNAEEIHTAAMVKKATALAEIYGGLLIRLSAIEGAADRVAAHVEQKRYEISSTLIGDEPPGAIARREAFSARVRELLQEKRPKESEP